jgi:hypothetical protein
MPELNAKVTLQPRGPAAAIVLTDAQVQQVTGGPKTAPVSVEVNGHTFPGRVARMGGENLVGLNKAVRQATGVEAGDTVQVRITLDVQERTVEVPDDLTTALDQATATASFAGLAASHRKEYVRWITEAKRPETRAKRIAEAVELIKQGKPRR